MEYKINGLVKSVSEPKTFKSRDGRDFTTRSIILDSSFVGSDGTRYENFCEIEFPGEKAIYLDRVKQGDRVSVSFIVSGRMYTGRDGTERCYTRLSGRSIINVAAALEAAKSAHDKPAYMPPQPSGDLPF